MHAFSILTLSFCVTSNAQVLDSLLSGQPAIDAVDFLSRAFTLPDRMFLEAYNASRNQALVANTTLTPEEEGAEVAEDLMMDMTDESTLIPTDIATTLIPADMATTLIPTDIATTLIPTDFDLTTAGPDDGEAIFSIGSTSPPVDESQTPNIAVNGPIMDSAGRRVILAELLKSADLINMGLKDSVVGDGTSTTEGTPTPEMIEAVTNAEITTTEEVIPDNTSTTEEATTTEQALDGVLSTSSPSPARSDVLDIITEGGKLVQLLESGSDGESTEMPLDDGLMNEAISSSNQVDGTTPGSPADELVEGIPSKAPAVADLVTDSAPIAPLTENDLFIDELPPSIPLDELEGTDEMPLPDVVSIDTFTSIQSIGADGIAPPSADLITLNTPEPPIVEEMSIGAVSNAAEDLALPNGGGFAIPTDTRQVEDIRAAEKAILNKVVYPVR